MDRESGRSRGFGFVTYTSAEEAGAAITGMDGKVNLILCFFFSCSGSKHCLVPNHESSNCSLYGVCGVFFWRLKSCDLVDYLDNNKN